MSEADDARCCICLGVEHTCTDLKKCCCAPLMLFCSTCSAATDNSDKRACTDCLQRMMAEYAHERQENNSNRVVEPKLRSKNIADFRKEIATLTGSKFIFAANVMQKSFLHTVERMVMKGVIFNLYCPTSFLCVVSTVPDFTPVQALLVRTLFAQRWFPKSTTATLIRHHQDSFRVFETINVEKIAFLQRAHLFDSCVAINANYDNYQHFLLDLVHNATFRGNQAAQLVHDSIAEEFDQHYEETAPSFEQVSERIYVANNEAAQRVSAPLQRTMKDILCPMCRNNCKVSTYIQSKTEKEEVARLQFEEKRADATSENVQSWNIRHEQRRATMIFDEKNKNEQCACCVDVNRSLIEEGKKLDTLYKSFTVYSIFLIGLAIFVFLYIDKPFQMCFWLFFFIAAATAFEYRRVMTKLQRDKILDLQIFNHCAFRLLHAIEYVLRTSSAPGMFAPLIQNESLLSNMKKYVRAVPESKRMVDPINLLIELRHTTWSGAILDRTLQFIYANNVLDCRWSLIAQGILSFFRCFSYTGLVGLATYRLALCEHLFEHLRMLLTTLATMGDRCRFRLQKATSFAASIIYLRKDVLQDESASWQFSSAEDRQRLLTHNAENKKILFERVAKPKNSSIDEDELLRMQAISEIEYLKTPFHRRMLRKLQMLKSSFISLSPSMLVSGALFASYPGHDRVTGGEVEVTINQILGFCGRTLADCLLFNTLLIKLLACFLYVWATCDDELVYKTALGYVLFIRIELVLLVIRLVIPLLFKEVWLCSDLSNSSVVTEISNYCANNYFLNFIVESNRRQTSEDVAIDAIRVGSNLSTEIPKTIS